MYDYLGYYDICYIGDEVKDPGRTIPRSIIISVIAVAIIYLAINLSVIGVVPWREFVPWDKHPESAFLVSAMMEKIYGTKMATAFTAMVLWTAFGSVFALLLGYSRIPYAAALDGYFFKVFGRLHPTKRFPYVALIVLGLISIVCSFFSLDMVIDALISPNSGAVHRSNSRAYAAQKALAGHAAAIESVAVLASLFNCA